MERWSLYKSIEFTKRATRRPEIDKQVRPVTARVCIRRGYLNDPGCGPPCYLAFGQHRQRRNTPPPLYRRLPPQMALIEANDHYVSRERRHDVNPAGKHAK